MKLLFTRLTIFLSIIVFSFSASNLTAQQVINVAAGANLNAVRNNVRSLNDNMSEDIIVNLAGGNYFLTSTLNFDANDAATNGHRIIWKNANNERPVISGGVEITGWQNEGSGQGIIYASVPNGFRFRQLYVNNVKAKRAAYLEDTWARGTFQASQKRFVINRNVGQNASIFDSLIEWNQIGNVEVNNVSTFVMRQTKIDRIELASTDVLHVYIADPAAATLQNQNPPNYVYDIYFENAFEFIDEQGEWYLDEAANIVYYKRRTGETAGDVEVMAPAVERLIDIQNTNGLTFFGLTFQHSTWLYPSDNGFLGFQNMYVSQTTGNTEIPAAIHIESSDKIQFERNVIRHTGGTGMMAFDNALTDLNLIGNVFYETAAGGLQLGNDNKKGPREGPEGLYQAVVQNNYFFNVGFEYSAPVVFGTFPYQLDFKHNEMINSLAMGLNLGWGFDAPDDLFYRPIVKYNKFQSICQVGTDASVYHTRNRSRGALVSENWFDNTVKVVNLRRLGRFTNTVNDPKFGNLYLDNDALDNNFVRNAHTNFSDNGYGPQLQNNIHIFGASSSPNYIVDDLGASTVTQNNAGLTAEYADIVNYSNAGSIGGNKSPSDHVKAAYLVDDRDVVVTYTGSWTTESSGGVNRANGGYLNTYTSTTANGAELSLSFTGDGIEFIAPTNSAQATVQIFIDNVLQTTLNLSGSDSYQDIKYTKTGLNTGSHTLKIRKTGGTKLQVDAFQVFQGKTASTVLPCPTFATIEAEAYDAMLGVVVGSSGEGGQKILTTDGDWARYDDIDLTCATGIDARVASLTSGGTIEVRIDSVSGTLIGTLNVGNTGSWQTWTTVSGNINNVTGVHDVYLVFTGGSGLLINLTWFEFNENQVSCPTFSTIEAEAYDDMLGVVVGSSGEGGQKILTTDGDWARYDDIDLTCATGIDARVASLTSGGTIEVRIDSVSGTLIGTLNVGNTGSWQTWTTVSGNINNVTGVHDVYLVFTGGSGLLINLTWFEFSQNTTAKGITKSKGEDFNDDKYTFNIYPNPSKDRLTIQLEKPHTSPIIISDLNGRIIDRIVNTTDLKIEVDVSHIPTGMYLLIFENQEGRFSRKISIMK